MRLEKLGKCKKELGEFSDVQTSQKVHWKAWQKGSACCTNLLHTSPAHCLQVKETWQQGSHSGQIPSLAWGSWMVSPCNLGYCTMLL